MTRLCFRPEFDALALAWIAPDERPFETCSVCDEPLSATLAPLVLWRGDGWSVQVCESCIKRWMTVVVS